MKYSELTFLLLQLLSLLVDDVHNHIVDDALRAHITERQPHEKRQQPQPATSVQQ